jgi:hypothetical protein
LHVAADDLFKARPDRLPERLAVGFAPRITDAELATFAVAEGTGGLHQ